MLAVLTPTDWVITSGIIAFVLYWSIYDIAVYAYFRPVKGWPTITQRVRQLSGEYPVLVLALGGFLGFWAGHLFGQF